MLFVSAAPCLALVLPLAPQDHSPADPLDSADRVESAEGAFDIASLMPDGTLFFLEGPGLSRFLDEGLEQPLFRRVMSSSLGDALRAKLDAAPEDVIAHLETLYGMPLFETASSLLEGGVALGLHARERGKPGATFAARSNDDLAWTENLEKLLGLASTFGDLPRAWVEPDEGPAGSDTWSFGPDLALAQLDGTVVASNDARRHEEMLTRLTGGAHGTLHEARYFAGARANQSGSTLVWGWLDMQHAEQIAEDEQGLAEFRRMPEKPAVVMLLGTGIAALGRVAELTGSLDLDSESIRWRIEGHGAQLGAMRGLVPHGEREQLVMPRRTEREVGRLTAYRDFSAVFEQRAELFPAELLPEFSRVSSELAPLLGGLDLGDDILPGLSPWIRVVAREVDFDSAATPELPLPAVVGMVDLDAEGELGDQLVSSFQTIIGVVNIERAQQGEKPMLLFLEQHGGIQYSAARLLPPGADDGVDITYNLVPACAIVGDTFLIGSHLALVREVAEQLRDGDTTSVPGDRDRLELSTAAIQRVLRANRNALVMNAVLEEGKSFEEAGSEADALLSLLGLFERAEYTTRVLPPERGATPHPTDPRDPSGARGVEVELRLAFSEAGR